MCCCTNPQKFQTLVPTKSSHLKRLLTYIMHPFCFTSLSLSPCLPPFPPPPPPPPLSLSLSLSLFLSPSSSTFFTFQAARVSHQCGKLKQIGFYIRSRPYQYNKTSLLELDSYLAFTQAAKLRVSGHTSLLILCLCW